MKKVRICYIIKTHDCPEIIDIEIESHIKLNPFSIASILIDEDKYYYIYKTFEGNVYNLTPCILSWSIFE